MAKAVKPDKPLPRPDFEEQLKRLEEVAEALESGSLPLEKSVALYKEGVDLARGCRALLEKAQHDVRLYSAGALLPFDGSSGTIAGEAEDAPLPEADFFAKG